MEKNMDGIKKLDPEEIKKNRKIVLSYIGEKDTELAKEQKALNQPALSLNKVDGIKLNKIPSLKEKVKGIIEKPVSPINNQADKQGRTNREEMAKKIEVEAEEKTAAEDLRRQEEEKTKREKTKQEELTKKEITKNADFLTEEKAKAEEARKLREKLKLEERIRREKKIIEENKRLGKIQREEEIKRINQEIKLARIEAARERKIKRRKAIKFFKKNLKNKLEKFFIIVKQNFVYGTLYLIIFLIIGYVIFCLLVLRFNIDEGAIGKIANILPVPAVISSQGIINYYDFRDIKNSNYDNLNLTEKKNILAESVILKNLSKKYRLPLNPPRQALVMAFAADEDFNQIGLSRIKKISELLKGVDNIEELSKYADEYSDVIYYNNESVIEKFGQSDFNLNSNKISDVIISKNGYFILQIVDNKNGRLGIKYLFVEAKTLDQYIGGKLAKIKIFILAN